MGFHMTIEKAGWEEEDRRELALLITFYMPGPVQGFCR